MSLSFFFQPQFRIFNQTHHYLLFCKSFTVFVSFLCGWNLYTCTSRQLDLNKAHYRPTWALDQKIRFGGATWLFLKIKHKNGNWCLPLGQSHVESPHPPSFIVYIHTPGKVVILQRPSLFLTSLSVRKFISSEIGRFQLCGGNLTNIISLESLGTCHLRFEFLWPIALVFLLKSHIFIHEACRWKPSKPAVCL